MEKKSILIQLESETKKKLKEMAQNYNPPLILKPYLEFILKEFSLGNLIKLKK